MDENTEPTGIDRRTLIKRAGIVGAGVAVWSAPSVTSLASRAYAAGSVSTSCKSCGGGSFPSCNPNGGNSGLGGCFCFERQSAGCVCGANTLCADAQACSSQSDCPSGYTCVKNTLCGTVCVSDCNNTTGASTSGGHGLTATGVTY